MLPDFQFYAIAIPAVLLVGFSKGGMGEALSLMGVPLLSLAVSPVQAAALLLPILIAADLVALWTWRKHGDMTTLKILLPGALIGIVIGWATAAYVARDALRLIIGAITVLFVLRYVYNLWRVRRGIITPAKPQRPVQATFFGGLAGYGSFVAHAGGPPFQIYTLPLKYRHNRAVLRHPQRRQAHPLFRARATRSQQSHHVANAVSAGNAGNHGGRLGGPAHAAAGVLSIHVYDGVPGRVQARL
jgi:uncharacterized membrane protein YfcA